MPLLRLALCLAISSAAALGLTDAASCAKAGGSIKKYGYNDSQEGCLCRDGSVISSTDGQRCIEKARTPEEIEALCAERSFAEPTVGRKGGPARLTAADLAAFAKNRKVTQAQALFAAMEKHDDWKRFHVDPVEMGHSESAEFSAVSKEHPRRLQFDRGLVIANTSHPGHADLNEFVQIFEADPEFGWRPATLTFENGGVVFDPQPKNCTTCHGKPPRPNWGAYRFWPGASRLASRGRFGDSYFNAFLNDWNFRIIARRLEKAPGYSVLRYAMLGALLRCKGLPDFLGPPESAFRQTHEQRLGKNYADIEKEVHTKVDERLADKEALAKSIGTPREQVTLYGDARAATGLRYLFEGAGVNVKNFSLDYTPGSKDRHHGYNFNSNGSSESGLWSLACYLLPDILRSEPKKLAVLGVYHPEGYDEQPKLADPPMWDTMCETLKTESLAAIAKAAATRHSAQANPEHSPILPGRRKDAGT